MSSSIPTERTWDRRFVRWLLRPLVTSPITPNHITALRLTSGLAAGILYAFGGEAANWAAGIFLIAVLTDHADGELARMKGGPPHDRLGSGITATEPIARHRASPLLGDNLKFSMNVCVVQELSAQNQI